MRRSVAATLVLASSLVTAAAYAKKLTDPATDFSVELPGVEGSAVCVTLPREEADDTTECPLPREFTPFRGLPGERLIGAAIMRNPAWEFGVVATVREKPGIGEISAESIVAIENDLAESVRAHGMVVIAPGGPTAVRSEIVEVHGARGLRLVVNAAAGDARTHFVTYSLYQQDRAHNLVFLGPLDHAADIDAYAARTVEAVKVPPGVLRMFGRPRWRRNLQWYAAKLMPGVIIGVAVIAALWLWQRRAR